MAKLVPISESNSERYDKRIVSYVDKVVIVINEQAGIYNRSMMLALYKFLYCQNEVDSF